MPKLFSTSELTNAIKDAIEADLNFAGFHITIGGWRNDDSDIANQGWCGIYRDSVTYNPRTLGRGSKSWRGTYSLTVIVQACSYRSGEECESILEDRVKNVLKVLFDSDFARTYINALMDLKVDYFALAPESGDRTYFQEALINFTCETTVDIT